MRGGKINQSLRPAYRKGQPHCERRGMGDEPGLGTGLRRQEGLTGDPGHAPGPLAGENRSAEPVEEPHRLHEQEGPHQPTTMRSHSVQVHAYSVIQTQPHFHNTLCTLKT